MKCTVTWRSAAIPVLIVGTVFCFVYYAAIPSPPRKSSNYDDVAPSFDAAKCSACTRPSNASKDEAACPGIFHFSQPSISGYDTSIGTVCPGGPSLPCCCPRHSPDPTFSSTYCAISPSNTTCLCHYTLSCYDICYTFAGFEYFLAGLAGVVLLAIAGVVACCCHCCKKLRQPKAPPPEGSTNYS
ncbi:Aste57867_8273 [Aphanomyces stellatus]|uniref:Aste57867_8273 protein n=1 Tax=Aphanomyces stellatus TaxID=120398 RepID=A0A485KJS3_9STRA|nr:hypothetical protein As57867_008242 [Aphanomyces stellatus]VFT85160.1 Aste57867_8273 [Aphanomyces stellatus]